MQVNRICTKLLNVTRPGLGDLNTVLSAHIAPFILPVSTVRRQRALCSLYRRATHIGCAVCQAPTGCIRDSIHALCAHPVSHIACASALSSSVHVPCPPCSQGYNMLTARIAPQVRASPKEWSGGRREFS
jgi:hypothetical protein